MHVGVSLQTESIRFSKKCSPQDNHVSFKVISDQTPVKSVISYAKQRNERASSCFPLSLVIMFSYIPTPFSLLFLKREEAVLCFGVCRNKLRKVGRSASELKVWQFTSVSPHSCFFRAEAQ